MKQEEKYVSYILDENASNPEVKITAVPLTNKSKTNELQQSSTIPLTDTQKTKSPESRQPPSGDQKLYVCEMCNYSSNLKNSLLRHQKLLHSTKTKRLTNGDVAETNENKTGDVDDNKDEDQNGDGNTEEPIRIKSEPIDGVKTETESEMEIDVLNNEDDAKIATANHKTKYCKSCGISFNYFSTYLAHKKFYCSSHVNEQIVNNNNDNEHVALSPTSAATGATAVTGTTAFLVEKS